MILSDEAIEKIWSLHRNSKKVVFDTREIKGGELFWALPGTRTHGNKYVNEALQKGAIGAICSDQSKTDLHNVVVVKDTLKALQQYATWYRKRIKAKAVIGVTGSSGKTTTRSLISHVLSSMYSVSQPERNFNNHIGVPITILNTPLNTDFLVLELGANHIGEIEFLCQIAQPTEGLITNIGRAHLEGFGSFEGVIQAKTELYRWIDQHGDTLYVNCEDALLINKSAKTRVNKIYYGVRSGKITARVISANPFLKIRFNKPFNISVNTQLAGKYNLYNMLAAAAVGLKHNIPLRIIAKQLATFRPVEMRSNLVKLKNTWVWYDAYNANPDSMLASLKSFTEIAPDNRLFVLGSMKELGKESARLHRKILEYVIKVMAPNDKIVCIGQEWTELLPELTSKGIHWSASLDSKIEKIILNLLKNRKYVFLKGSRENRLELVFQKIKELLAD